MGTGGEQFFKLAALLLGRVFARETRSALELHGEGIQRAVLMMRRAEIANAGMRVGLDVLRERDGQPRLADPRLAGDQHDARLASLRLIPAPQQQIELLVAPDEGGRLGAQRLEAADDPALAQNAPRRLR